MSFTVTPKSNYSIESQSDAAKRAGGAGFALKKPPRCTTLLGPRGEKGNGFPVDYWPDCGVGANRAYVEDRVIVRVGMGDTIEGNWNKLQLSAGLSGRPLRSDVEAAHVIPLKEISVV